MRNKIIQLIEKSINKNIYFLTADLGFSVLENLKKKLKKNFLNVGVSENNMFLVACGLTIEKKNQIYLYSISPFLTLRNLEIIRNYISSDRRNIRMIGVGSGVSYSTMGKTHFNLDDINIIYSLKNILILNPSNYDELIYVYRKFKNYIHPIYYRINKFNFENEFKLKRKNNIFYKKGKKTNLVVSGAILNHLLKALNSKEIKLLNIISIPIMNHNYIKNFNLLLNKNQKTVFFCDSSKTLFFEELRSNLINKKYSMNFDCDHNKIKKVGSYTYLLNNIGLDRKNLIKILF